MITYTPKVYLGDAVFVQTDSLGRVIVSTEDGTTITNQIYMEPEVLAAFDKWRTVLAAFDERSTAFVEATK